MCAVMAVDLAEIVKEHLNFSSKAMYVYTDSQVVLGYISNETRRFHVYVSNRVSRIRSSSESGQWQYVQTDKNPADLATRSLDAKHLPDSIWIHGPAFLKGEKLPDHENFPLINPEYDHEIRSEFQTLTVNVQRSSFRKSTIFKIFRMEETCLSYLYFKKFYKESKFKKR